jgi:tRNA(Arg) A34 adenosine deaminase TadA
MSDTTLQVLEERMRALAACWDAARHTDHRLGLIACEEALGAARAGNYGVGAVLVDPSGEIAARGGNQAFFPRFRSDLHAEMVVMNAFEERYPQSTDMRGYSLFCSLEPCPMCLARLLIAGVESVKFIAQDELGGMVSHVDHLPEAWQRLRRDRQFVEADVSEEMKSLSTDFFVLNLQSLREQLWER